MSMWRMPRPDSASTRAFITAGSDPAQPTATNPLGAKGCGEAGCAGSLPSVMNAIVDALGGRHVDMPATAASLWALIAANRQKKAA